MWHKCHYKTALVCIRFCGSLAENSDAHEWSFPHSPLALCASLLSSLFSNRF
ncbi:hypothetical protein HHE02_09660 [Helicobacter heilmannii]|nr:hypothetical protein HHE014_09900 [Helicobacter heilmannii]CRF47672.1 hypothetical protein HHE02_09660 [Helicobacter heilmannii]CRF49715.1 hypothetical protein HHE03_13780 [Helicobacter heilmannii]